MEDDGPGLPVEPEQALDPFFTTKRNKTTGLGLSLFRQAAEEAGGGLDVDRSVDLGGVAVRAWMSLANVDRPPLGDVATSILTMVATNPEIQFADRLDRRRRAPLAGRWRAATGSCRRSSLASRQCLECSPQRHHLRSGSQFTRSEGEPNE